MKLQLCVLAVLAVLAKGAAPETACGDIPAAPLKEFDINQLLTGKWYEIAVSAKVRSDFEPDCNCGVMNATKFTTPKGEKVNIWEFMCHMGSPAGPMFGVIGDLAPTGKPGAFNLALVAVHAPNATEDTAESATSAPSDSQANPPASEETNEPAPDRSKTNYLIMAHGPHYEYMVVAGICAENIWILSRTPTMEETTFKTVSQPFEHLGMTKITQTGCKSD